MVLNNIINHLIIWCRGKAEVYWIAYKANGGGFDIGSTLAYELVFKLETLIDRPFEGTDALKREVLALLDVHYEPGILKPQNRTAQYSSFINEKFCIITSVFEFAYDVS